MQHNLRGKLLSIGSVHDATSNLYPPVDNDQPSYKLEIENSWRGRQFKITNSDDKSPQSPIFFQRKQIFINGFCAKYLKGFNKINEDKFSNPYSLKILEKKCYIKYENLNVLFKCVKVSIFNTTTSKTTSVTLPVCLKIVGLKRYLHETMPPSSNYKLSILVTNNIYLQNPYTLNFYTIDENAKINFYNHDENNKEESKYFDRKKLWLSPSHFQEFQSNINELSSLVCYFENTKKRGSGFLISHNKILTNAHVIIGMEQGYTIKFFFDDKNKNQAHPIKCDIIDPQSAHISSDRRSGKPPDTKKSFLDFVIIELSDKDLSQLEAYPEWKLMQRLACKFFNDKNIISAEVGMPANIIHYPEPEAKKITFQSNEFIQVGDDTYHYKTPTDDGSSGSPIISNEGKFLGYHYASCDKIINEAKGILNKYSTNNSNNNNDNILTEFTYKDIEKKRIEWIVRSNATCLKRTKHGEEEGTPDEDVSLIFFLDNYKGSLENGDKTPEFFDKEFIEIHQKHKYCKCGIPATLLKKNPSVQKIFEENKKYLIDNPKPRQPQASPPSPAIDGINDKIAKLTADLNTLQERYDKLSLEQTKSLNKQQPPQNKNNYLVFGVVGGLLFLGALGWLYKSRKKV